MVNSDVLKAHKQNLMSASSFEEYKAAHVEYVQMLIDRMEAEEKAAQSLAESERVTAKFIWRVAESAPEKI